MEKVKYDYSKLKGRIREYFGTQDSFAESLDLSSTSMNSKLNGKVRFTQDEIYYAIQRLNIKPEELLDIFLEKELNEMQLD